MSGTRSTQNTQHLHTDEPTVNLLLTLHFWESHRQEHPVTQLTNWVFFVEYERMVAAQVQWQSLDTGIKRTPQQRWLGCEGTRTKRCENHYTDG